MNTDAIEVRSPADVDAGRLASAAAPLVTRFLTLAAVVLGVYQVEPPLRAQQAPDSVLVQPKIVAGGSTDADHFGHAVARSGDLLVSTAPFAPVNGNMSAGAIHVFLRDAAASGWTELKRVQPLDPAAFQQFGLSVALDGDTLAVGAPNAAIDNVVQQGAVYVFERHQGGPDAWGQVARLTDGDLGFGGHFGSSVALQGDLLIVGADASSSGSGNGQVTIHERNRGGVGQWGPVTTLDDAAVADGGRLELFGSALALQGDLLLVGASRADVSGELENDGAAYLFRRDAVVRDTWTLVRRFITPGADRCTGGRTVSELALESPDVRDEAQRCAREESNSDNDFFGAAVALDGDLLAIGARSAESQTVGVAAGAVYVFERSAGGADDWAHRTTLSASDPAALAQFGRAVAVSGGTVLAGADGAAIGGKSFQGAAYVFERNEADPAVWQQARKLIAADGFGGDSFGRAVLFDGATVVIGASGDQEGRGAIYLADGIEDPPPVPVECQPAFEPTDTLASGSVLTGPAGVLLGAVDGTVSEPLPVWIREVAAPTVPIFAAARPLGGHYNIGARCTTFAPVDRPFVVALPVPEGTDTTRLGVATLVPAASVLDGPASGELWKPVTGVYDATNRLYIIVRAALQGEGTTFTLVEHPDLSPRETSAARAAQSDDETPEFDVTCFGFDGSPTCTFVEEAFVAETMLEAYRSFRAQGFPEPALASGSVSFRGDGGFTINLHDRVYRDIFISPDCEVGEPGFYAPADRSVTVCMDPATGMGTEGALRSILRHELFHAIQFAHESIYNGPQDAWVMEGTAEAAIQSDVTMHRSPSVAWRRALRRVDVGLTRGYADLDPEAQYPYESQDFWVHLFQASQRNLGLGELTSFFPRGGSTAAVADRLENPPTLLFANLGREYFNWAKNQVMEKTVTFDGELTTPCRLQDGTGGVSSLFSWPSVKHVFGSLENLQTDIVKITLTERMSIGTILAERGGTGEHLAYKVYIEGEAGCRDVLEGERNVRSLGPGTTIYVVVSNIRYVEAGAASPLYKVVVRGG
jgi:hypothetical protein